MCRLLLISLPKLCQKNLKKYIENKSVKIKNSVNYDDKYLKSRIYSDKDLSLKSLTRYIMLLHLLDLSSAI